MIAYGWREQNDACWGIESCDISGDFLIDEDGSLSGDIPEGQWFKTFAQAKRAAIRHWTDRVNTAKCALRDLRKYRKPGKPPIEVLS